MGTLYGNNSGQVRLSCAQQGSRGKIDASTNYKTMEFELYNVVYSKQSHTCIIYMTAADSHCVDFLYY